MIKFRKTPIGLYRQILPIDSAANGFIVEHGYRIEDTSGILLAWVVRAPWPEFLSQPIMEPQHVDLAEITDPALKLQQQLFNEITHDKPGLIIGIANTQKETGPKFQAIRLNTKRGLGIIGMLRQFQYQGAATAMYSHSGITRRITVTAAEDEGPVNFQLLVSDGDTSIDLNLVIPFIEYRLLVYSVSDATQIF